MLNIVNRKQSQVTCLRNIIVLISIRSYSNYSYTIIVYSRVLFLYNLFLLYYNLVCSCIIYALGFTLSLWYG